MCECSIPSFRMATLTSTVGACCAIDDKGKSTICNTKKAAADLKAIKFFILFSVQITQRNNFFSFFYFVKNIRRRITFFIFYFAHITRTITFFIFYFAEHIHGSERFANIFYCDSTVISAFIYFNIQQIVSKQTSGYLQNIRHNLHCILLRARSLAK